MSGVTTLIFVGAVMFAVLGGVTLLSHIYKLNINNVLNNVDIHKPV